MKKEMERINVVETLIGITAIVLLFVGAGIAGNNDLESITPRYMYGLFVMIAVIGFVLIAISDNLKNDFAEKYNVNYTDVEEEINCEEIECKVNTRNLRVINGGLNKNVEKRPCVIFTYNKKKGDWEEKVL